MKYENESDPSVNWGHLTDVDFTADTDHVSAEGAERYAAATLRNRGAINAALAAETSDAGSHAETIVVRFKVIDAVTVEGFARVTSAQGISDETDTQ